MQTLQLNYFIQMLMLGHFVQEPRAARAPTREEMTQCGSQTVEELFSLGAKSSGNASNSSFMRQEHLNIHQSTNLLNCETKRCEEN